MPTLAANLLADVNKGGPGSGPHPGNGGKNKPPKNYGKNFSTSELKDHYRALIGEPKPGMNRSALLSHLHGTGFDEHAYS